MEKIEPFPVDASPNTSGDEQESEEDWDTEEEVCEDSPLRIYKCLFNCREAMTTVAKLFSHLKEAHEFDIEYLRRKFSMDQMSFVKMVNWRRELSNYFVSRNELDKLTMIGLHYSPESSTAPWNSDQWIRATVQDDPLLNYWFEDPEESDKPAVNGHLDPGEFGDVNNLNIESLRRLLQRYQMENSRILTALARVESDNVSMKNVMDRILNEPLKSIKAEVASDKNEDWYFDSYDELSIHAQMLRDAPRTIAYRDAILKNKDEIANKTVMDLGCGTGILSLFCVKAGAEMVHAVENSKIIFEAMDVCFENDCESKVNFLNKKLESIEESEIGKVDILVSEWMGYFLNFEGMLSSYLDARDKFLKPSGKMFPSTAQVYMVALSDTEGYKSAIEWWEDVYGYKMSIMKRKWIEEPAIHVIDKSTIVSNEVVIKSLDLHNCKFADTAIKGSFDFKITKDCELTGICGYFDVGFEDCEESVFLNTSPLHEETHWKQTVFFLPEKYSAVKDEVVNIKFQCDPHPDNSRWLKLRMNILNHDMIYEMK